MLIPPERRIMSSIKRCLTCKYCKTISSTDTKSSKAQEVVANYYYCDFLTMSKKMRGCPAGDNCTQYIQKRRRRKKSD